MFRGATHRKQFSLWLTRLLTGFVFLCILSSCTPTPSTGSKHLLTLTPVVKYGFRPFIDTWNNIHTFQTFDYNISDPASIASRYDFVWGANVEHVAAIRAGNPNIFITYYIPFHVDWGTFARNDARQNVAYWKKVHPDWILYKCDRVTPAYEFHHANVPLDFANPAVVAWQVATYALPASEAGYDGIAADNLDMQNLFGGCGFFQNGKWVQRYTGQPDDPQWRADVITWLTLMQASLHRLSHPLALIPNLGLETLSLTDPQWQQVVNHIDGLADEEGFTNDSRGYLTDGLWQQRVQFMEMLQQAGKPYYVVNQFPRSSPINQQEFQWAVASYLMGKEHYASVFVSTYQDYGNDSWYAQYDADIGTPSGAMYQAQNVYFRQYSHGLSIVNPGSTLAYTVFLGSKETYKDLYGLSMGQTVTLGPHTGLVLLNVS